MSKLSKGGLVGLLYNDFNQRQKSGVWTLEDHVEDTNYIRTSEIPNNYLAVGCYDTNSLYLFDMFFKSKLSTNIFNIPKASVTCIDYNYQNNMLVFGLNNAPYLKIYNTETFIEYILTQTISSAINCLRFDHSGDFLFVGYLESQNDNTTHIIAYNMLDLISTTSLTEPTSGDSLNIPILESISITMNYLPTCIRFTKDDEYLCIGHYGTIENEYNNTSLYKYVSGQYLDITEYNLTNFKLQTPTDICFVEDLELLFISSYKEPYLYCYNYKRQDLVQTYNSVIPTNIISRVNSLVLTKNNRNILIGCELDPYLYILDLTTKTISIFETDIITSSIVNLSLSYNDQYLCVTTRDRGLHIFDYATKEIVPLSNIPESTSLATTFFFGPVIEYIEIDKPLYSASSNDEAMVYITQDSELYFTGTFFNDSVIVPIPDLAAHKNIFQTQIYFSLDFNSTIITSITKDGTIITNDNNIINYYSQNYFNNIIQIDTYYSRVALLDSYGSVQILLLNAFSKEEQFYIVENMSKNIKQISIGQSILLALTNSNTVISTNLDLFDPSNLSLPEIKQVSCGKEHIVLLTYSGTVLSYGDNTYNQCDTQTWTNIKKIDCGDNYTIALTNDNVTYISGINISEDIRNQIYREAYIVDIFSGPTDIIIVKSDKTIKRYQTT